MSTVEPNDVGPVVGGNLRASDTDREQVARLLNAAFAEGRLTREEHDARQQAVLTAVTFDDLVPLTRDLVPLDGPAPAQPWTTPPGATAHAPGPVSADPDLIFTIFGGTNRKGVWTARRYISILTLFGGTELDFTHATWADNVCEISVFCMFGGISIRVPQGVAVRNDCLAIFGGADSHTTPPQPGAPTLIVKGFVGFGGVEVKGPKRGL